MTEPARSDLVEQRIKPLYLWLFAALYALQGIIVGYFFNFSYGYMAAAGVDDTTIAAVQSIVLLPMVFKFVLGPISDRFSLFGMGRRKPYIILGLLLQSVGLFVVSTVDPGAHLQLFGGLLLSSLVGLAFYDTCCDGMVIEVTPENDRNRVQGILMASRFVAAMASSIAFGYWLSLSGNGPGKGHGVLIACAALGVLPLVLALVAREPVRDPGAETFRWSALKVLVQPRVLALLLFGALYSTIGYAVEVNLSAYYSSPALGLGDDAVGGLGALRYIGRAAGALLLPLVALRWGRFGSVLFGVLILAAATSGQALALGMVSAGACGFLFGVANGWNDALFCVLAMDASHPKMAASTYALIMAVSNVSLVGGYLFAIAVAATGSYAVAFLASGAIMLVSLIAVKTISRPFGSRSE